MEKRLKQPPIHNYVLKKFDLITFYEFKLTLNNFLLIMKNDIIAKQYYRMYKEEKINKEEMKQLLLSHIKYFYDLDYKKRYGKFMSILIEKNKNKSYNKNIAPIHE